MGIEQGEFSMQEIMFLVSNISKFTVKKKLKNISLIKEEQELVAITDNWSLTTSEFQVFVNDQFLNWDPQNRIKVRIVSARAYHSLFMHNM